MAFWGGGGYTLSIYLSSYISLVPPVFEGISVTTIARRPAEADTGGTSVGGSAEGFAAYGSG